MKLFREFSFRSQRACLRSTVINAVTHQTFSLSRSDSTDRVEAQQSPGKRAPGVTMKISMASWCKSSLQVPMHYSHPKAPAMSSLVSTARPIHSLKFHLPQKPAWQSVGYCLSRKPLNRRSRTPKNQNRRENPQSSWNLAGR